MLSPRAVYSLFLALALFACGDNLGSGPSKLDVSPSSLQLVAGDSGMVSATFTVSSGSIASADLTWESSNTAVATVTPGTNGQATVRGISMGSATITASGAGLTATVDVTVGAKELRTISVTPPTPSIAAGTTQQLTATGIYSDSTMADISSQVTWASSASAVASVDSAGLVTGHTGGSATVTATLGTLSDTASVTVTTATLISIALTPPNPTIALGTTVQLTAMGTFSDSSVQDVSSQVTWSSSAVGIATISTAGLVTSVGVGGTNITATLGAVAGHTSVTVSSATLLSIDVTPTLPSVARGLNLQLTATGHYSDATTQDLTATATWSSATTTIATVSNAAGTKGLAHGVNLGTSVITATVGAFSGTTTLTVTTATLVSIAVTPALPSVAKGLTKQFTATGTFSDATTQDLTATVVWSSDTVATATISNAAGTHGLASTVAVGTALISATSGAIVGSTTLTVTAATLVSIAVTPTLPTIAKGLTQQFTATGTFTDLSTQDLTATVTWSSATTSVATISNATGTKGLATGAGVGTSIIKAASGTINGTTTLTVTAATLVSIAVTPVTPSVAAGRTLQLTATGTFTDASTQNLTTSVTWTSATTTAATISNAAGSKGLATGVAVGTSLITATSGIISGSTTLTVTPAVLVSIQVTPILPTASAGTTLQFTATGTFSDATTSNLTNTVTWSSGTTANATISNAAGSKGLATAVAPGPSVITATSGTISGSTTLTVSTAVLVSISVSPTNPTVPIGLTQQFTATGVFSDATTQDLTTQVTWTSSDGTIGSISNAAGSQGLATGIALGTTSISATLGPVSGSTNLTVAGVVLVSIAVTPANPSVVAGLTQQFTATGTFSDGSTQDLTLAATWASSATAVAQISNAAGSQGLATVLAAGTATISAQSGTITGSTTLTGLTATLVSIAVTPVNPSVAKGLAQQFTATGTFTDGSTADLTGSATWGSSDLTIAQISNAAGSQGVATTLLVGTSTITATSGAVSGSTTLTVTAAVLASITVAPLVNNIVPGGTVNLTATGHLTDGTTSNLTSTATWTSGDVTLATVTTTGTRGVVTGVAVGTVVITATSGAIFGTATVNVLGPAVTLINPFDGLVGVRTTAPIIVTFNQAILPATVTAQSVAGACTGAVQVSADNFATCIAFTTTSPTFNAANTIATLTPGATLTALATYKVKVLGTVTNAAGALMGTDFTQTNGFTVATDGTCASALVISQVYGAGGNAGAPFNADYVELYNAGTVAESLAGLSIQYASTAGTTWQVAVLPSTSVAAGHYYLVQMSAAGTVGTALTADFSAAPTIAMAAGAGKIALASSTTALSGACPLGGTLDFVGYGAGTTCNEGGTLTGTLSATLAAFRANLGCNDTNVNGTDFTTAVPAPRNSATAANVCSCPANETDKVSELTYCNLQFPGTTSQTTGLTTATIYGQVYSPGITEAAGDSGRITMQMGYGASGSDPRTAGWTTWINTSYSTQSGNNDEYLAAFLAPAVGTYSYTSRATRDGTNWTYCDLDGAGTNAGLSFDVTQLGVLTVTP